MLSFDISYFCKNGKYFVIGVEVKCIVMPFEKIDHHFLFASCAYSSSKQSKMVADGRQCDKVFKRSLCNVLPTFGLTKIKDEQKQALL